MNLEPRERLAEEAPVREGALGARTGGHVPQAALQAQNLTQPLDVSPRERQRAESRHSLDAVPGNRSGLGPIRSVQGPVFGPART